MTPEFALDLDHEGIRLLRMTGIGWQSLGHVELDDPDMAGSLAELRNRATAEGTGPLVTELIIPPSQIFYTTIQRPDGLRLTEAGIRPLLAGLTPVDVDELVFDWEAEGDVLHLAVLEKTTLQDAEHFADASDFSPLSFSARPDPDVFPRDPDFGATSVASRILAALPDLQAQDAPREQESVVLAKALAGPAHDRPESSKTVLTLGTADNAAPFFTARRAVFGLGLVASAAIVWGAFFLVRNEGPSDPGATLSDTPPSASIVGPDLPQQSLGPTETEAPLPVASLAPEAAVPVDLLVFQPDLAPNADTASAVAFTDDNPLERLSDQTFWTTGVAAQVAPTAPDIAPNAFVALSPVDALLEVTQLATPLGASVDPVPVGPFEPPVPFPVAIVETIAPAAQFETFALADPATPGLEQPGLTLAPEPLRGFPTIVAPAAPDLASQNSDPLPPAPLETAPAQTEIASLPPEELIDPTDATSGEDESAAIAATPEESSELEIAEQATETESEVEEAATETLGQDLAEDPVGEVAEVEEPLLIANGTDLSGARPLPRPVTETVEVAPEAPVVAEAEIEEGLPEQELAAEDGEVATLKPRARPATIAEIAAAQTPTFSDSAQAVAQSTGPRARPEGLASRIATNRAVAAALAETEEAEVESAPVVAVAPQDTIEDDASTAINVARRATIQDGIRLRDVNLVGVFGTDGNRRALVRLGSGRIIQITVGDRLDGGRVAAISQDGLRYVKGGESILLTVPSG